MTPPDGSIAIDERPIIVEVYDVIDADNDRPAGTKHIRRRKPVFSSCIPGSAVAIALRASREWR